MAEGHTIHRLARDLRELVGTPLCASSPQGRFPDAKLIDGLPMVQTDAYGKHLFMRFDIATLHIHLGLAGKFSRSARSGQPRPQVRLRLATSGLVWDLVAPTRCELLDEESVAAVVARLGPDPLRPDADPELVRKRFQRYSGPIAAALLDQSLIAGVGNVFRAEALNAIGIHPSRPAAELTPEQFDALWRTLRSMMQGGVEDGRIITVVPPSGAERRAVPEAEARYVYKQERCRRCGTPVEKSTFGNRTAYWCPGCQT